MSEVQVARLRAETDLAAAQPSAKLTVDQALTLVASLGNIAAVLADVEPRLKSQLYEELGISLT